MNKPAAKEPSMDEILSSIRQIIADDDATPVPRRPSLQVAPDPMEATPASSPLNIDLSIPLALSSEQIVPGEAEADIGFEALLADAQSEQAPEATPLVVPDDISFSPAAEPEDLSETNSVDTTVDAVDEAEAFSAGAYSSPEPEATAVLSAFNADNVTSSPEPVEAPKSFASSMPDSKLSFDIAEGLLESSTKAAVRSSIDKLGAAGIGVIASPALGNGNATIESMVREMLRPMLKEWLDENLPSVVERMVEKEIARVARGD
jgi:cell pole-organizing protein PopZ